MLHSVAIIITRKLLSFDMGNVWPFPSTSPVNRGYSLSYWWFGMWMATVKGRWMAQKQIQKLCELLAQHFPFHLHLSFVMLMIFKLIEGFYLCMVNYVSRTWTLNSDVIAYNLTLKLFFLTTSNPSWFHRFLASRTTNTKTIDLHSKVEFLELDDCTLLLRTDNPLRERVFLL